MSRETLPKAVISWLAIICALIGVMVAIGGITRLTGAGLSITEWRPITGAIPPLNEAQWLDTFGKYQQTPQYRLVNQGMSLAQFKVIFFWEYLHRLIGRLIAIAYVVPWLVFTRRGLIPNNRHWRIAGGLFLLVAQGLMGWLMVASGLSGRISVSHYRLAGHLSLALITMAYLLALIRATLPPDARRPNQATQDPRLARCSIGALLVLVGVQTVYGALMAGLKAGYLYASFPKMHGRWIPAGMFELSPGWINLLDNPATVHFIHRMLGFGAVAGAIWLLMLLWAGRIPSHARNFVNVTILASLLQFCLGVLSVISRVAIPVAAAHQMIGTLLLAALLWTYYSLRRPIPADHLDNQLRLT